MPKFPKKSESIRDKLLLPSSSTACLYTFDHLYDYDKEGNILARVFFTLPPKSKRSKATLHLMTLPVGDWSAIGKFLVEVSDKVMRD